MARGAKSRSWISPLLRPYILPMCVGCVMGAAAGFGLFQTYRYVLKDRARGLMNNVVHVPSHKGEAESSSAGAFSPVPPEPTPVGATGMASLR